MENWSLYHSKLIIIPNYKHEIKYLILGVPYFLWIKDLNTRANFNFLILSSIHK